MNMGFVDRDKYAGTLDRIDWCDVYKGIAIFLVVVGHATGKYNSFIYQFHMAAFFFISGYTGKVRKEPIFKTFIKKFYKLMIPYYVICLSGILIFWVLKQIGILDAVSTTQYPAKFQDAFLSLFAGNGVYCDWLGALWFLQVLFLATIIFIMLTLASKKDIALFLVSILVFFCSMGLIKSQIRCYYVDLAGVAQVFLVTGYLASKIKERNNNTWQLSIKIVMIGLLWWGSVQLGFTYVVDWPSRSFNGAVDLILPVFGILLLINISRLLAKNNVTKRLFVYLGQNSMGIMCFHFIGFKIAYIVLILLGKMEADEVYRLTPDAALGDWWFLISAIAIFFSILLWEALNRCAITRVLIGGSNGEKIYGFLLETKLMSIIKEVYDLFVSLFGQTAVKYWEFLRKQKCLKAAIATCIAICGGFFGVWLYRNSGEIEVIFPQTGSQVVFGEGWLPQSSSENYRWFNGKAELRVFLISQDKFKITGYIPDNVENISYMAIKVNGVEAYHEPVDGGQLIDIQLDISDYVNFFKMNSIEVETDGVRIPGEEDEDKRTLSAFINMFVLY